MLPISLLRRAAARLAVAGAALACALAAAAEEPDWLELATARFAVLSQLDEAETRAWAVELARFVGGLENMYPVDEAARPPLTLVLFREARDFAPYRLRTSLGQAHVAAFFGNTGDWSIVGMPVGGRDERTRETLYHEAVHWHMAASDEPQPLWFAEGLAEALSTFEAVDGRARWGKVVEENVAPLLRDGVLPMQELLRASQDEVLHAPRGDRYYPQAWAFVHRMLFGNGGADAPRLSAFLEALRTTDPESAAAASFGASLDALTSDLRRHLERLEYAYVETPLGDDAAPPAVAPADAAGVELTLGRLAIVGGNLELALAHAERVAALAPDSPAGHELAAYAAHEIGDDAALDRALERARELSSRESWIYATTADRLLSRRRRPSAHLDDALAPDVARAAADLYERALALRPRNEAALAGLAIALLNVETITPADAAALEAGRSLYPADGLLLVGAAAAAKRSGDVREAARLLSLAAAEPFTLPKRYRASVAALRTRWLGEWLLAELGALTRDARFAESRALVAEQLADPTLAEPLRSMLESLAAKLPER
jgi:tetratricopeptide (TPR) repeat protein